MSTKPKTTEPTTTEPTTTAPIRRGPQRETLSVASLPRLRLGGTMSHLAHAHEALALVRDRLNGDQPAGHRPLAVASSNLDHIHHFGRGTDPAATVGAGADPTGDQLPVEWLVLLDGAPLVWRTKVLTGRSYPRLTGADLLPAMLADCARTGARIGFFGGTEPAHQLLDRALREQYPSLDVAGYWAPTREDVLDPQASRRWARTVREHRVDVLVVGLGKPRQERWIAQYGAATGARVLLAFGAAADFIAGTVSRAPGWMQDHGLEWAYRLAIEPRRLARRYLVQGPRAFARLTLDSRAVPAAPATTAQTPPTTCTALVVTYNSADELPGLLTSLRDTPVSDLVIVDNGSVDATVALARQWVDPQGPRLHVVQSPINGGYAAGINLARAHTAPDAWLLILNPDVTVRPGCVEALLAGAAAAGVAVPTILDRDGEVYPSLRREPTPLRALGDALLGGRVRARPGWAAEMVYDRAAYRRGGDVDWATGAALLVSATCADVVGDWDEGYFLYSEETDFCRRARDAGFGVRHVPTAVVVHQQGASGTSDRLAALLTVNRVRYVAAYNSAFVTAVFRAAVAVQCLLRIHRRASRLALRALADPAVAARLGRPTQTTRRERPIGSES